MNEQTSHSRIEAIGLGRNATYMFLASLIIAGIIGFMAGRMVESVHYDDKSQSYHVQIQGLEKQLADHKKEIDYYKNKSGLDDSKEAKTVSWIQPIAY